MIFYSDTELAERLCWYDPRNPMTTGLLLGSGRAPGDPGCPCAACTFGKHWLADELLLLRELARAVAERQAAQAELNEVAGEKIPPDFEAHQLRYNNARDALHRARGRERAALSEATTRISMGHAGSRPGLKAQDGQSGSTPECSTTSEGAP